LNKLFFPINIGFMHWVCAVVFMQERRIQFYDSMGNGGEHYLDHIFHYLKDEYDDKNNNETMPDADKWDLVPSCTENTPQQVNGFDCGVFTCMNADFLSNDCRLAFRQTDINMCRNRIGIAIIKGVINGASAP
jgi:sentrin-specific protease 1